MASPTDRRYSNKHIWAKLDGNEATFGLTENLVSKCGSVTSVTELASISTSCASGDIIGKIQGSTNDAEFRAPLGGNVIDREEHMQDISHTNTEPYGDDSWFIKIDGVQQTEYNALMTGSQYDSYIQTI